MKDPKAIGLTTKDIKKTRKDFSEDFIVFLKDHEGTFSLADIAWSIKKFVNDEKALYHCGLGFIEEDLLCLNRLLKSFKKSLDEIDEPFI